MKLTLRAAARLIKRIDARRKDIQDEIQKNLLIKAEVHDDPDFVLKNMQDAEQKVLDLLPKLQELIAIKFYLREAIGKANHVAQIDSLLTELGELEEISNTYNSILVAAVHKNVAVRPPDDIIRARILGRRNQENRYGDNSLYFGVLGTEVLQNIENLKTVRAVQERIRDQIETKNGLNMVDLSDEDADNLTHLGVVV